MTRKIKKVKQMQQNGQWSADIPIGITLDNGLDIEDRFNNTEYIFDTVADMVAANYLKAGDKVKTLGYYSKDDLGGSLYKIREKNINENTNEMDLVSLYNTSLLAEFIPNQELNIKQFGAYTDDSHDDSNIIQHAIDYISENFTPFIQAGSQIELNGNYKDTKVTKTIKIPHTLRAKGLYLNVYEGNYEDSFLIKVNIDENNSNEWKIGYPRENIGYLKESRFYNKTQNSYHCILNASNNTFKDISVDRFDISYKTINKYLDHHKIVGWHVTNCIDSENYAIFLGFLGDNIKMENCSVNAYNSNNTYNLAVDTGQAHNGIIISNCIIHGNINVRAISVKISNIHMEGGKIFFNGSNAILENSFLWKDNSNINISSSSEVKISNVKIIYRYTFNSYENTLEDDITIDETSNLILEESYKHMVGQNITANCKAFLKISSQNAPVNNIRAIVNGPLYKINGSYPFPWKVYDGVIDSQKMFTDWYASSGTYYYKAVKIIDFDRMLAYTPYNCEFNLTYTQGQGGMRSFGSSKGSKWRFYRGTRSGVYSQYADLSYAGGEILDNGFMLDGNKWKGRTSGGIDSFNNVIENSFTKYDENDNIICHMSNVPTVGTWKVDDIVITTTKTYICTGSNNSGGVWREI